MNTVKEINRINERELELGVKGSWHDEYKDSAYIYIGGLAFELTEGDVIAIFSQFGEIMDCNLIRDKETGKSRGFCFLMYEDQRSTVLAVDNMNGAQVVGRTLRVDHTKNYKQPGKRNEEGEYEEPEGPVYNAMPPILSDSDDSSEEEEAQDSLDEEDPMAAFIRAEKKAQKALKGKGKDGKKRKHEGESKEERRARKEAKRAKKEGKGKKSGHKERGDEREDKKGGREERGGKREDDGFWSKGAAADDWRQGRWELEREERNGGSRARGDEPPSRSHGREPERDERDRRPERDERDRRDERERDSRHGRDDGHRRDDGDRYRDERRYDRR
ncbi:hypothetical protein L202_01986 [Cryptococcus amylolentus CBS 6039]|uniref:RRM domain-containing protein n=2 Tax=Cryptococcus amylolentus TaxID=104669 RepID=A0A1E3HZ00_9TREE|nr:hypothetical protein L202_01986 [Cryptococcus amylolentus CBS 6039]ODN81572.1 hypothetical protein L202_01986 [Cryptococcus amylolentus CBS 6039]ODO10205.1 hypothetical protein I350_02434 [Cryptococcus amylolentus CBS 6273]